MLSVVGQPSWAHLRAGFPPSPSPGCLGLQACLTVSCPCPVFSPPAHTNSHGSNMLSHANCYGILSPCRCPSPQGLPLGRFREENGIFQAVSAFKDLEVQPPYWRDGKTEAQRGEAETAQVMQRVHRDWPSPRSPHFQPIASPNPQTALLSPPPPIIGCLL